MALITGSTGSDSIPGTNNADIISALSGNDTIDGRFGIDVIDGGPGEDSIRGGGEEDDIAGGGDNDRIDGGGGNDNINGGAGNDTAVYAGARTDYYAVRGLDGVIRVIDLRATSPDGADTLTSIEFISFAGETYSADQIGMELTAPNGGATVVGSDGSDTISGGNGPDELNGGDGDDYFTGAEEADTMNGGAGIDTVTYGGLRDDYLVVRDADGVITVTELSDGGGYDGTDTLNDVEFIAFAGMTVSADDVGMLLEGDNGDNLLTGGDFPDTATGGGGDDTLAGGGGADTAIFSGALADYTIIRNESDVITVIDNRVGEDGTDTLTGFESLQFSDQTITASSLPVTDTIAPVITAVTLTDSLMAIDEVVTVIITVTSDSDTYTLGAGSTVAGYELGALTRIDATTYTAEFTVTAGADVPADDDLAVDLVLVDTEGNESVAYTTAISQANDAIDATRPVFASAHVDGDSLQLDYEEELDEDGVPEFDAFEVTVDGETVAVTAVTVSGPDGVVTLTLETAVRQDQVVTVAYADPTSGDDADAIQDAARNDAVSLAATAVTNDTVDSAPPVITGVSIPDAPMLVGDTVTVTITVEADPDAYDLGASTVAGEDLFNLTKVDDSTYTAEFTVSAGTNYSAGDDLPVSIVLYDTATNGSDEYATAIAQSGDPIDTAAPTFSSATVNGATLVLTWSETLDAATLSPSDFVVTVAGAPVEVSAVNVSGAAVTLTLASAVSRSQAVTVAYDDPAAGDDPDAIQDTLGIDAADLAATPVTNNTPAPPAPPEPEPEVPAGPTPGDDRVNLADSQLRFDAGSGADFVNGGGGDNTINGGEGDDSLFGGAGNDQLDGGVGSNYLRGGEGQDQLTGGDDFDDLHGNVGDDTLRAGGGGDWVVGGQGSDALFGEAGGDVVLGNLGGDNLDGGEGNDAVRGGQANDTVMGGAGDDWLSGDRGSDTVSGGAGADTFHSWGDAGLDVVTDFNFAEGDRVNLLAGTVYTVSQVNADTVIDMVGGGQLVLQNVKLAALDEGWIGVS